MARTMQSVLTQTYPEIETILVDDGSTDDSYAIAKTFEGERVKLVSQQNAGAACARNYGIQISTGNLLQFLDAGDVMDPEKIALQVSALKDNMNKVAVCGYKQFTTDSELRDGSYPRQDFIYTTNDPQDFLVRLWGGMDEGNFIQTNCWLVPRSLVEKVGGWRNYRCPDDDGEFFARILLASEGIVFTPGVYNYYHIAPGGVNQLSRSKNKKYLQNSLLTIDLKHMYLKASGSHPHADKAIARQYLQFAVDQYPAQRLLSKIAYSRYKSLRQKLEAPLLGGKVIEFIKHIFGWRVARIIRYYLRRS